MRSAMRALCMRDWLVFDHCVYCLVAPDGWLRASDLLLCVMGLIAGLGSFDNTVFA